MPIRKRKNENMGKQTAKMQEENLWKDPASGPKRTIPVHIVRLYPRNKKNRNQKINQNLWNQTMPWKESKFKASCGYLMQWRCIFKWIVTDQTEREDNKQVKKRLKRPKWAKMVPCFLRESKGLPVPRGKKTPVPQDPLLESDPGRKMALRP